MKFGWSILLIMHGILAVFLLGAITHQAVGVAWPVTKRSAGFVNAIRGVNGTNYTNAIVILFLVTFTTRHDHLSDLSGQCADGVAGISGF